MRSATRDERIGFQKRKSSHSDGEPKRSLLMIYRFTDVSINVSINVSIASANVSISVSINVSINELI